MINFYYVYLDILHQWIIAKLEINEIILINYLFYQNSEKFSNKDKVHFVTHINLICSTL